jgi:drug/metabolite transporter (DMT)-like permease
VLGPSLALGASLVYGLSDFLGGTLSRRIGTLRFTVCAQLIGVSLATCWVVLSRDPVPRAATLAAGVAAGLGITVGLYAFFQAMVVGTISVVAPISATGVVLPIAAGIARGELLTVAQTVGIVCSPRGCRASNKRSPGNQVSGWRCFQPSAAACFSG